jgi:hypothetical protein
MEEKKGMHRSFSMFVFVLAFLLSAGGLVAAPVECTSDLSYAAYLSAGSCVDTDDSLLYVFNNYSSSATPGLFAIPASGVTVNFGSSLIQFVSGWVTPGGQQRDSVFDFAIIGLNGRMIDRNTLDISTANAIGGASVSVSETMCLEGEFTPGCSSGNTESLLAFKTSTMSKLTDTAQFFMPVQMVSILKDLTVDGGLLGANGFAAVSQVTNAVDTVIPEPASMTLLGLGLFGFEVMRRRRREKTS